MSLASGLAEALQPVWESGNCCAWRRARRSSSAFACCDRHAVGEPGNGVQAAEVPIEIGRVVAERNPEVGRLPVRKRSLSSTDVLEARRHDADDDKRPAREVDRAADDCGIGTEPCAPDPIAQDDAVAVTRTFVVSRECAAERDARAEQLDETGGDEQALEVLRSRRAAELMAFAVEGRGTGEGRPCAREGRGSPQASAAPRRTADAARRRAPAGRDRGRAAA